MKAKDQANKQNPKQQKEQEGKDRETRAKDLKKEKFRMLALLFMEHSMKQELVNQENKENQTIDAIFNNMQNEMTKNSNSISLMFSKYMKKKEELRDLKKSIKGLEEDIEKENALFLQEESNLINDFNSEKEKIMNDTKQVEEQLNRYAEWQRQADSYQTQLSDLKSQIHKNRVGCSEVIAQTRQNAQAKIEKHRVDLAEAIRKARAESLRLRSGDISELSTTFLTQSEQQVESLNSQLEASRHLSDVNDTIEEDNLSMQQEIGRLKKKTVRLREQAEKQKRVIEKLNDIKTEFQEREKEERLIQKMKNDKKKEQKIEKEIKERSKPPPKPQFQMTKEQESFITFLNECATSVRSVLKQMLDDNDTSEAPNTQSERFEAPKLSSMIAEIKQLTQKLEQKGHKPDPSRRPVLTPAAAYFAFSAPFDESDEFIPSENWSFAKYQPLKNNQSQNQTQSKKPKIVRIKTAK